MKALRRHGGDNAHDASLTVVQLGLGHVRHGAGSGRSTCPRRGPLRTRETPDCPERREGSLGTHSISASLSFVDEGRQGPQAGFKVGVAHGDQGAGNCWPAANGGVNADEVQHEAILGAIKSTVHGHQRAVLLQLLGRHGGCLDIAPLSVVVILHRVVGVQWHLVKREAGGEVDGVRPRHIDCKTDADPGQTLQRSARHIVLAGDGQVDLVPAPGAVPRLVGVAQQYAEARLGVIAACGYRVAAHFGRPYGFAQLSSGFDTGWC